MKKYNLKIVKKIFPKKGTSENGFVILVVENEKGEEEILQGNYLPEKKNTKIIIDGEAKIGRRGPYIEAVGAVEFVVENNKQGIIEFMKSSVKGIGPKSAEKLYDILGDATLDFFDAKLDGKESKEYITKLSKAGFSESKLTKIIEGYREARYAREIFAAFIPLGISASGCLRICKNEGAKQALELLDVNPWGLCKIDGYIFNFETAERIAKDKGLPLNSKDRINGAIFELLNQAEYGGHYFEGGNVCVRIDELAVKLSELLNLQESGISYSELFNVILELNNNKLLKVYRLDNNKTKELKDFWVYSTKNAENENVIIGNITGLLSRNSTGYYLKKENINAEIEELQNINGLILAESQKQAAIMALNNKISIITGGPGTGKSLIMRFICDTFERIRPEGTITLCAPTGKAARRMEESTGREASTIHKALNIYSEDCELKAPFDTDLVIIDEFSMVDHSMAANILKAVNCGRTQLVIIGDTDQLPSVGAGAVLRDLLNIEDIPRTTLCDVFRQQEGSAIVENAAMVKNTQNDLIINDDFQILKENGSIEDVANLCIFEYYKKSLAYGSFETVLLTPNRGANTPIGAEALNERLEKIINKQNGKTAKAAGREWKVGDKIMQLKNTENVSNGDIGVITQIKEQNGEVTFCIDFEICALKYDTVQMRDITLAYASTIHKSQGSEYDVVIVVLHKSANRLLQNNLLYTAITRAKKKVVIIASDGVIEYTVKNKPLNNNNRKSLFSEICNRKNRGQEVRSFSK